MPICNCRSCSHWDPLPEGGGDHLGLCSLQARAQRFDGWSVTGPDDTCEEWIETGYYRDGEGDLHAERRSRPRHGIDYPASLHMPGGDRSGRLADISETGARLQITNAPRVGTLALLKWASHEVFCTIAWSNPEACGVTFERPIDRSLVLEMVGEGSDVNAPRAKPGNIPLGTKRTLRRPAAR